MFNVWVGGGSYFCLLFRGSELWFVVVIVMWERNDGWYGINFLLRTLFTFLGPTLPSKREVRSKVKGKENVLQKSVDYGL